MQVILIVEVMTIKFSKLHTKNCDIFSTLNIFIFQLYSQFLSNYNYSVYTFHVMKKKYKNFYYK